MAQIGDAQHDRFQRVPHGATCNANPYGAATSNAALTIVATGERYRTADRMAERLAMACARSCKWHALWCAYGRGHRSEPGGL